MDGCEKQASLCCQLSIFTEWQVIRKKNVAGSINQEATQMQAGMQHVQKLIHAAQKTVRTVWGRNLLSCAILFNTHAEYI